MKFLCEQCKAKYQIADEKAAGKTVRMKCRKCGHLIEVRASVTETSVSPVPEHDRVSAPPPGASPPPRPAPPRAKPPTPKPPPAREGAAARPESPARALAGAFRTAIRHEDETSPPVDMSDLSPSDEWYVAINGVPVGPIRVAEVRRKAALGAVSEDSLVWQEGLDEWRPLRTFPELATSVREAMRRLSRPPAAEVRSSAPPPPPSRAPGRSIPSGGGASRTVPPRAPPSSWPRSNVVPFMSRLATAEKLDQPVPEPMGPVPGWPIATPQPARTSVVPDPFGNAQPAQAALAPGATPFSVAPPPPKKSPPWIPLAMIAAAIAFGVTAAVVLFRPAAPAPVALTTPGALATAAATSTTVSAPAASEATEPGTTQVVSVVKGPASNGPKATPSATAANPGRSLDLHSLTQNAPSVSPVDDQGSEGPKAAGQCISEGQVQQVIGLHQTGIRRACWERNPTMKPTVNVGVMLTIGADGSAQSVSTSGDEPSVSKCIENDLRNWRFPAMGCSQKTSFSFKFVRQ